MKVRSSVFASFILMLEVLGVALFLRGFFPVPVKSSLSSKNKLSDLPPEPLTGETGTNQAPPPGWHAPPLTRRCSRCPMYLQEAPRTRRAPPSPCSNGWLSCWWTPSGRTLCLVPMDPCFCPTRDMSSKGGRLSALWPRRDPLPSPCRGSR